MNTTSNVNFEHVSGCNATSDLDIQMDHETSAVMKERVASTSREGYDRRNVSFMIWLFDQGAEYHNLFGPGLIPKLNSAHERDRGIKTKKAIPVNSGSFCAMSAIVHYRM